MFTKLYMKIEFLTYFILVHFESLCFNNYNTYNVFFNELMWNFKELISGSNIAIYLLGYILGA